MRESKEQTKLVTFATCTGGWSLEGVNQSENVGREKMPPLPRTTG